MWRGRGGYGRGFFPGMGGMWRGRRHWRNRMFGGPFGGWGFPGFGYGGYGYGRPRVSCCCLPFFLLMLAVPVGLMAMFALHVI